MNPDISLIRKYNIPGPRYTSYPTAVQFEEVSKQYGHNSITDELSLQSDRAKTRGLSLYFHIPFCFSLCWYCGCTKIITKDSDRGDIYLDYLEMEMDLMRKHLQPETEVVQIHFGGGTPTFLRPEQLRRLGTAIHSRFNTGSFTEFSVEIDPRRCTLDHVEALREIGCNRASLGVQDTNPDVQEAIHRIQPLEQTAEVTGMLRVSGINEINFDLIYGLPRQTPDTFRQTIEDVMLLSPDRLAVYSYAHIPSLMPSQKLLDESEFPSAEMKLNMMVMARESFPDRGMRFIGMDHFAKENDSLSLALDQGTLQRNFQGYSTYGGTQMLAFGMSGISQLENAYFQNTKNLAEYYETLEKKMLPVVKELRLNRDDKIRKDLIMQVMCQVDVHINHFSDKWDIDFKTYFKDELSRLDQLEADGLVIHLADRIKITETGRLFLRNIAMIFDGYLKNSSQQHFSKTV
ncbi:MAG: oxygen-independent coproporphyrinogen III oxidase [Balneolaceae bacterium]